jgi:hypothetical protein
MSTLAEIKAAGEGLMANCAGPNCGHGKMLPLDLLIYRYGADYEMTGETRIASACKCERCGHRGAVVHLIANSKPTGYSKAKGR